MSHLYMRNKASGEIRDVESDSREFLELQREVTSRGLPMWEQTSSAHAEALGERAASGNLRDEDLGWEHQANIPEALVLDRKGVAPEKNPHLALTPGEIEMGMTPESKLEDLKAQLDQGVASAREGILEEASESIAKSTGKERKERQPSGPLSARAGGSDDRDDAPQNAGGE